MDAVSLDRYASVVGPDVTGELARLADAVRHLKVQHVNSTPVGGGVAELLTRLVPLLRELGIETRWDVIKGDREFFDVTKAMHNALHGAEIEFTEEMTAAYRRTTEMNLAEFEPWGDNIFIHDPQPAGLIEARSRSKARWLWRCHIDVSSPHPGVWAFLEPFITRYDAVAVSMPSFARPMPLPFYLVAPSIDPISDKNRDLEPGVVRRILEKYGIDPKRPVVTQISRFDRLKDPIGVIQAYRLARRREDCQLVLAGGGADDDPEGAIVLQEVREAADGDPDIHVLELPVFSDIEINALVRGSTIVLQKSIREGFGLTVAEALWKRKPVIGSAVGGIISTVLHGITGYLVHSPEGAAHAIVELLTDPELCRRLGENGHQHVRTNFLTTRHGGPGHHSRLAPSLLSLTCVGVGRAFRLRDASADRHSLGDGGQACPDAGLKPCATPDGPAPRPRALGHHWPCDTSGGCSTQVTSGPPGLVGASCPGGPGSRLYSAPGSSLGMIPLRWSAAYTGTHLRPATARVVHRNRARPGAECGMEAL